MHCAKIAVLFLILCQVGSLLFDSIYADCFFAAGETKFNQLNYQINISVSHQHKPN